MDNVAIKSSMRDSRSRNTPMSVRREFIHVPHANFIHHNFLCKTCTQNNDKTLIFLKNVFLPKNTPRIANQAKENGFLTNYVRVIEMSEKLDVHPNLPLFIVKGSKWLKIISPRA